MNDDLISRLHNWKFTQALQYTKAESSDTKQLIKALARTFGDSGWFAGDMGTIVSSALESILEYKEALYKDEE